MKKLATKRRNLVRNIAALFVGGAILAPSMAPELTAATITWDANAATAGQTDGGGAWLGTNQWWDGLANVTWTLGDDASFGNGGAGGAVTLASPTSVNSLTFNTFTGTYTLGSAGQAITLNNGITMNAGAGAVTLISPITLGAAQSWTNNSSSNLTIGGATVTTTNLNGNALTIGGSGNTTFDGAANVISGAGGIVKNGSGVLILDGGTSITHTFTGGITINGGAVRFQNATNVSGRGNVTITGGYLGGRFNSSPTFAGGLGTGATAIQITGGISGFSGEGATGSTFTIGSAGSVLKWGATGENGATGFFNPTVLILGGDQGMNANAKGTLANGIDLNGTNRTFTSLHSNGDGAASTGFTVSGVISNSIGTAGFEKTGPGNVILGNANTYNGTTTITGGSLTVGNTASLGSGVASNTLIFNGGTLLANAAFNSVATRGVTMTATGIINTNAFAVGILGDISGAGGLTKNSTGTLTLSGTNTYGGATTVNAGTLAITKEASLASNTAANLNIKSGATLALNVDSAGTSGFTTANLTTLLGNISVANTSAQGLQGGAAIAIDTSTASGGTFTQGNAITNSTGAFGGQIALTKLGAGILILDKANTYTGATTITAGTLQLNDGGTIASSITNNSAFVNNSTVAVMQGTHFGLISGNGTVTQLGAGTLTLNQANTYTGNTTVSNGTIAISNPLAMQNSAYNTTGSNGTTIGLNVTSGVSSGTLTLGGLAGSVDLASAFTAGFTGTVANLTLNPQTGVSVTYGGVISDGSGAMTLTKTGAGTQILTGANTYTGATIVNAGTLTIGAGGSLSSSSALQINGGTFSYGNTTGSQTLNGLTVGAGNSTVSNTAAGQTLTLGAITRTAGLFGTVNFATLTGPISTTTGNVNSIIGPWATTGTGTALRYAVGSPDGVTPTNISALTGTTATAGTLANVTDATANYEYSAAATTTTNLTGNTLRYSGGAATTAIGATNTLTLNGLMQAGTGLLTISGGPTTGGILIGSTGELVIAANGQGTTISAAIGGTGRLVYNGAGSTNRLLLSSTTSSYTGGTVINSGQLAIASDAALGSSTGSITLNGGTLVGNSTNPQSGNGGGVNITSARDVIVGPVGGAIGAHGNNSFTTTGKLTGSGTLTFADVGGAGGRSLNFNATTNDFTGRLVILSNSMTLSVNSLVDNLASGNIALNLGGANNGSTFAYGTGATSALTLNNRAFELNASGAFTGTIQNNNTTQAISIGSNLIATGAGAKTLTLGAAGTTAPANAFSGNITNGLDGGTVAVTKTGTGLWVLSGSNTYTGATTISAGTLAGIGANAFGNTSGISLTGTNTLSLRGDASTTFANSNVTTSATGSTINVDQATIAGTGAKTMTIGTLGTTSTAATYQVNFTGANNTSLNVGAVTGSASTAAATVTLSNAIASTGELTLASYASANTNGGETLILTGAGTGTISGAITPSSTVLGLQKSGNGTWTVNGSSSYTGATVVTAGTLAFNSIGNVGSGNTALGNPILANSIIRLGNDTNSGTIIYTGGTASTDRQVQINVNANAATGSGVIRNNGTGTLTFSNPVFNATYANTNTPVRSLTIGGSNNGAIQGTIQDHSATSKLALIKEDGGTWTLTGTNTYTGATNITGGTLIVGVGGVGSIGTSTTTVSAGATLGGSGTIGGATTVSGSVAPGNSIGTLNVANNVTWNGGNAWVWELGAAGPLTSIASPGTSDLLNITGDFIKGTGTSWTFDFSNTGVAGTYKLVDWTGTTAFADMDFTATNLAGGLTPSFTVDGPSSALYLTLSGGGAESFIFTDTTAVTLNVMQNGSGVSAAKTIQNNGGASGNATLSSVSNLSVTGSLTGIAASGTSNLTLAPTSTATPGTTSGTLSVTPDGGANDVSVTINVGTASFNSGNSQILGTARILSTAASNINYPAPNWSSNTTGLTESGGGPAAVATTATILMYNNAVTGGGAETVSMQWRTRTTAEANPSNPNAVLSDIVNLTGMYSGAENAASGTGAFVLQMNYLQSTLDGLGLNENAIATSGELRLGWNNGGNWQTAVLGNSTGSPAPQFVGVTDWNSYYLANSAVDDGTDLALFLGRYGVDPTGAAGGVTWAVVNHNSEFAVIPEPSTLVLGGLALLGLAGVGLRRRRMAQQEVTPQ